MLAQSGLSHVWWSYAMRIWNVFRNATDVHANTGKTQHEFRFREEFPHELIPLREEMTFKPESPKEKKISNKFSPSAGVEGIMLGYSLKPGGQPTGDIYILERTNLENATTTKKVYKERRIAIAQVLR